MRELKAIFATLAIVAIIGVFGAPAAYAQDDTGDAETQTTVEDCPETVVRIETRPIFTVRQQAEDQSAPPYFEPVIVFRDVLTRTTVDVEITEEVPGECPDEVESTVIIASPPLAVTGSNVSYPVAAGFAMIGVGGLAVMASRERMDEADDA